jgi:hypothetical protein
MDSKHILAVIVDCGKVTCADCDWHKGDDEDGDCAMFERSLVDGVVRCAECIEAQARADDMMLKAAMAKAAPQEKA